MAHNRVKKVLCLLLVMAALVSLPVTAYASDGKSAAVSCSLSQIKTNLIRSFLSHENFITKSIVRAQFRTVATAGAAVGCTTAAYMLNHSLQNKPANLDLNNATKYAAQIRNSSEFKGIISRFRQEAVGKEYNMKGSVALNSSPDLYLAYNAVSYAASGTLTEDGRWNITVKFHDTYDFEILKWKDVLTDGAVIVAICNYAAYAQEIHAIVPYEINITVQTSVSAAK